MLQYCLSFFVLFFDPEACMISARWPGIEHTHPALEGEGLTTGLPGKSLNILHVYTHTHTHTHTYIFHISHWTVTFPTWPKEGVTEQSLLWLKIYSPLLFFTYNNSIYSKPGPSRKTEVTSFQKHWYLTRPEIHPHSVEQEVKRG